MSKTSKVAVVDIARKNRSSNVISFYSKGLNQEDIAQELHVDPNRQGNVEIYNISNMGQNLQSK